MAEDPVRKPAPNDIKEDICPVCKMPLSQDICCPE